MARINIIWVVAVDVVAAGTVVVVVVAVGDIIAVIVDYTNAVVLLLLNKWCLLGICCN